MLPLSDVKISLSTLLEAGLVAAFIAGVVFVAGSKSSTAVGSEGSSGPGKKSKSKKRKAGAKQDSPVVEPKEEKPTATTHTTAPKPTPAQSAPAPTPAPKKKQAKAQATAPAAVPTLTPVVAAQPASSSADAPSFASIATLASTAPQPKQKQKKTAAEKALKPEPKTATTDMRDEGLNPTPSAARVLKVVGGRVGAKEPESEPWGDEGWEQVEEDGGWEIAKVKKPIRSAAGASASSAFSISNPAPARSVPGLSAAAQNALTTQQRKNEKQKVKAAAAKEEAERERLERLAAHRRDLERARMAEQDKQRNKGRPSGIRSVNTASKPASKVSSSAMAATLDSDSRLIWD